MIHALKLIGINKRYLYYIIFCPPYIIIKLKLHLNTYKLYLNILLTLLFYFPGMYHSFYTYLKIHEVPQLKSK